MAITLAEAKVGMANKVDQQIVDEFRRSSFLLDRLTFDNIISPGTGGSTLTYGYVQLDSPSTAGTRKINEEYTPNEAKRVEKTTKAVIMGGAFTLDRVIIDTSGAIDELDFQLREKVKATANEFHYSVINGTTAASGAGFKTNSFDGLRKLLAGKEVTESVDVSTSELIDTNKHGLIDVLDSFVSTLDGKPTMLLMNKKMLAKIRSAARRAGYYNNNVDGFGRTVEDYNGIILMDAGEYYNGTNTVDVVGIEDDGTSNIYAVQLGLNAFHGISPTGNKLIKTYLPDLKGPGAVKRGEVELVAGVALKNTLKAGILKGIKIMGTA